MSEKCEYTPVGGATVVDTIQEDGKDINEDCDRQEHSAIKMTISSEDYIRSSSSNSKTFLYLAASIANLASFTCGIALGWTSPALPQLSSAANTVLPKPLTTDEASWIGSLLPLGAACGPFAIGFMADKIGRKKTILLSTAPFIIAFMCFALAESVILFYIGRFLCGLGTGGLFTVLPMYIGEIAEDSVRGALQSIMQLFITCGLLFAYAVGPYTSIPTFSLICLTIPSLFVVLFVFFTPESPHYLISVGKDKAAEDALIKLRKNSNVSKELGIMVFNVAESNANRQKPKDMFKSVGLQKALLLSVGLVSFQQLSGINVILFYTQAIFAATGSTIPADISTILVGLVQVSFSCVTPLLVDKRGKRFLLLISGTGMALFQFLLGYYFRRKETNMPVDSLFWLPVLCLVIYNATYCVGFGPLPWALMGELFPANVKSAASTITASACWFLAFFITKYFELISDSIGIGFSFYLFGGFCILASMFVYKLLPETSGKSLQEIQDILQGKIM